MSDVIAVRGRPTGRGRPRGPLLHAVPGTDRTRSALCGARVGGAPLPWPAAGVPVQRAEPHSTDAYDTDPYGTDADGSRHEPGPCPECAALLEVHAA